MKSKKHNHLFLHLFSLPNLFTTSTDDCLFLQSILTGIFHVNIPLNNLSSVVLRSSAYLKQRLRPDLENHSLDECGIISLNGSKMSSLSTIHEFKLNAILTFEQC